MESVARAEKVTATEDQNEGADEDHGDPDAPASAGMQGRFATDRIVKFDGADRTLLVVEVLVFGRIHLDVSGKIGGQFPLRTDFGRGWSFLSERR